MESLKLSKTDPGREEKPRPQYTIKELQMILDIFDGKADKYNIKPTKEGKNAN